MKPNYFELKLCGKTERLRAREGRYDVDGTTAIELYSLDGEYGYEELYGRLTVNTGVRPPLGTIWAKTWSENKPMYEALVKEGYIEPTEKTIQCGFSEAVACRLTPKFKGFLTREVPDAED